MQITGPYYLAKLREGLSLKQRNNPHYSLRAYARDIGIHPATLSQIINGKRPLPQKDSEQVAKKLNLSPKEVSIFIESLNKDKSSLTKLDDDDDAKVLLNESYYKIIAEWEHYALLELFNVKGFRGTREEIAEKLDLTLNRTDVVINNLLVTGLLVRADDGSFAKVYDDVRTTEDITNQALRDSHKETLLMGAEKLDSIATELRDFSSSTLAIDMKNLPKAKLLIREFRKKMALLAEDGDREEIYQIAVQFYPLSKIKESNTEETCAQH